MLKALALDSFWPQVFARTKNVAAKKSTVSNLRFYLAIGLIAANLVLLMSYIYGVNDYASKGYQIKALQKRLSVLNDDNKKVNLKVSEASSMVAIQSGFLSANFVPAGSSKFLEVSANQFTQR